MDTDPKSPSRRALYAISVVAELTGLPVATLRLYEQHGLVRPARTLGGTRRYSDADVARIKRVSELVGSGITLAGVAMVLDLQDDNAALTTRNRDLRSRNTALSEDNRRLREGPDRNHEPG